MRATATAGLLAAACATMSGASAFAPSSLALRGPAAASSCRPAACGLSILSMGKRYPQLPRVPLDAALAPQRQARGLVAASG
jgi:hypothetical protein